MLPLCQIATLHFLLLVLLVYEEVWLPLKKVNKAIYLLVLENTRETLFDPQNIHNQSSREGGTFGPPWHTLVQQSLLFPTGALPTLNCSLYHVYSITLLPSSFSAICLSPKKIDSTKNKIIPCTHICIMPAFVYHSHMRPVESQTPLHFRVLLSKFTYLSFLFHLFKLILPFKKYVVMKQCVTSKL